MRQDVVIRPAVTMWDALAMRRMRNSCRLYMTQDTAHKSIFRQLVWWWRERPDTLQPYLVETDEGTVGYAILVIDGLRGWLTAGLTPNARGAGVGTDVFRQLTAMAEQRILVPSLEVRVANRPARAVYAKLGFKEISSDGIIMKMEKRSA